MEIKVSSHTHTRPEKGTVFSHEKSTNRTRRSDSLISSLLNHSKHKA